MGGKLLPQYFPEEDTKEEEGRMSVELYVPHFIALYDP